MRKHTKRGAVAVVWGARVRGAAGCRTQAAAHPQSTPGGG